MSLWQVVRVVFALLKYLRQVGKNMHHPIIDVVLVRWWGDKIPLSSFVLT